MDDMEKPECEFFTVSVNKLMGRTYIGGTDLGKQFLLGDLCKMTETNIFAAFLNFCRRKTKGKKVHTASPRKKASVSQSKNALKAVYMMYGKRKEALGKQFVGKPGNSRKKSDDNLPAQIQPSDVQNANQPMKYESKDLPESDIPEKSGARETLVRTPSLGGTDECNLLHTDNFTEADHSMGGGSAETEESEWVANNPIVKTFSLQRDASTQADEDSQHSNADIFPVVKQEPEWELDTTENIDQQTSTTEGIDQHGSGQTSTEARDSGIDDHNQMDTETSAETSVYASSDWQVTRVREDLIGGDSEENIDTVIKSEPVWNDQEEEFDSIMDTRVIVGKWDNISSATVDDSSMTVDNLPKFNIEEISGGDTPENEDSYSVQRPEEEEECSEGINNTEDPNSGEDADVRQPGVYSFGDHMYFMQKPCLAEVQNTNKRLAVKKLLQARKEAEAREEERLLALGPIKEETEERKPAPHPPRPVVRHPKTGKFCSVGRLRKLQALQKSLMKQREEKKHREEGEVDSITTNTSVDQQNPEKPKELRTVFFAIKIRSEWKCHCGETFWNQADFSEHDKEFHNASLRLCEYCGEFLKVRSYKYHIRSHFPGVRRQYQCSKCDKKYSNSNGLKKHIDFFHGGKRLICDTCGKKFGSSTSFQRHQNIHKKILNYLCNFCGKKFITKYALMTHRRVHTGEKPFSCEYCGLKFNHNVSRKTHIRKDHPGCEIHTAIRNSY